MCFLNEIAIYSSTQPHREKYLWLSLPRKILTFKTKLKSNLNSHALSPWHYFCWNIICNMTKLFLISWRLRKSLTICCWSGPNETRNGIHFQHNQTISGSCMILSDWDLQDTYLYSHNTLNSLLNKWCISK